MKVEVVIGDITKQGDIEAVVNSANPNLRLGVGVSGAIHMAAGDELEDYCEPLAPFARGRAVMTPGFKLILVQSRYIAALNQVIDHSCPCCKRHRAFGNSQEWSCHPWTMA